MQGFQKTLKTFSETFKDFSANLRDFAGNFKLQGNVQEIFSNAKKNFQVLQRPFFATKLRECSGSLQHLKVFHGGFLRCFEGVGSLRAKRESHAPVQEFQQKLQGFSKSEEIVSRIAKGMLPRTCKECSGNRTSRRDSGEPARFAFPSAPDCHTPPTSF